MATENHTEFKDKLMSVLVDEICGVWSCLSNKCKGLKS